MTSTAEVSPAGAEEEPKGAPAELQAPDPTKRVRALFSVGRANLTKEELESPGVLKMLVDRVDEYEEEIRRLQPIERESFEAKADLRVTKAELLQVKKNKIAFEILTTVLAAAGSAMFSASRSLFAPEMLAFGVGVSVLLIIGAIAAKIIQLWPR